MQTTTRVYQYGAVPTVEFPRAGIESLFQANKLWNNLVALHNESRERLERARAEADSEYALVAESIRLADEAVDQAYLSKREARAKAGTKDATHPLIVEANKVIDQEKAQRRELWDKAKVARKRSDGLIDRKELNAAFNEATNTAAHVENVGGLGNASAGAVLEYFKTARQQAFKNGAKLQFHRFDGTGFLFFRFRVPGAKVDGVPFSQLVADEQSGYPFVFVGRTDAKNPRLRLRVKVAGGSKQESKVFAYLDVILHRPLPEDAKVQNGKLIRRRIGDRFKYFVDLTVKVPAAEAQPIAPVALGVDIGFRQQEDGGIRVAVVGGSEGLDDVGLVEVPAKTIRALAYVDELKGRLDDAAKALGEQIKPAMRSAADDEAHKFHKLARSVAYLPAFVTLSFEKAYKLARTALREPGTFGEEAQVLLSSWLQSNGRTYRELHNLRTKILSSRKHLYRNVAASLAKAGRPIGIEDIDLSVFAETKDRDNKLGNTARSNRFLASPSELLGAIRNAAKREGLQVVDVAAAYTSKTCSACGTVNSKLRAEHTWTCADCGTVHDRDANAAVNIAKRALEKLSGPKRNS